MPALSAPPRSCCGFEEDPVGRRAVLPSLETRPWKSGSVGDVKESSPRGTADRLFYMRDLRLGTAWRRTGIDP